MGDEKNCIKIRLTSLFLEILSSSPTCIFDFQINTYDKENVSFVLYFWEKTIILYETDIICPRVLDVIWIFVLAVLTPRPWKYKAVDTLNVSGSNSLLTLSLILKLNKWKNNLWLLFDSIVLCRMFGNVSIKI